jgi:hypothetical protein
MNEQNLYQELNKDIQANIKKSEEFYKSISLQNISTDDLADYKIELGADLNAYRQQIWSYFSARYADQTKLKKHYFDLEKNLMDKQAILQDQETELIGDYEKYKNQNQVAISSIKSDKYEFELYKRNNKLMLGVMAALVLIILLLAINILGLLSNQITMLVGLTIFGITVASLGYFWYDDSNRNNNFWDLRNFNVSSTDNISNQCNSGAYVAVSDSQAKQRKIIDDKVMALSV